ncbi:MAG TPA: hypothetical protein PK620_11890 [Denitromonas sp.]|uniref:hypothetical protein n=1 Tax=Denitromonas sp. TaxID=2734609 RepID=UPI001DFAD6BD|nr:hypothetical protein [Rhodocyclaceae bacterium]MCP5222908.1 hypothetical protein [Zoogloeaceae bacterium]HPR05471.1 hypothetical protein [Denitromonas sp.]HQU89392.1 hypothetical protein [Denitromonas sp.]HQV15611.1 hypothetical protein [Denitromonas sp.]
MSTLRLLALSFVTLVLVGCAHPIVITPELQSIDRSSVKPIDATVAYYITASDREKEVITPGGGGDKVKYYPYKELEPALQKVLNNLFRSVKRLDNPNDAGFLQSNDISYVFQPEIITNSNSDSAFTWPPTEFTVDLNCIAIDRSGKTVWQKRIAAKGEASFSEFKSDFSLSAKRATEIAFKQLQTELNAAPEFRR